MTQLANDPAAILRILNPTVAGDEPSIAADMYKHGLGAAGEEVLQLFRKRREAAIEAHHEKRRSAFRQLFRVGRSHHLQLLAIDRQRLFDKDALTALQSALHIGGMAVVPRKDEDRVHIGVVEQLGRRFSDRETKACASRRGSCARAAGNGFQHAARREERRWGKMIPRANPPAPMHPTRNLSFGRGCTARAGKDGLAGRTSPGAW